MVDDDIETEAVWVDIDKFKKVKAIIAVHMQGYPCNLKKIRKIANDYNIKLIEDCAQAFGAKYSHYSRSSHKSVYVDNLEDYTSHDEVQIGKFANNGKNRVIIEKIYKITSKIVLVQLAISILLFFILK